MKTKNLRTLNVRQSIDRSLLRLGFLVITLVLVSLGILPTVRAVTPAPDGGYPGANTAEGEDALFSLTSGIQNTGLGFHALYSNTTGNWNTAIGSGALFSNIGGTDPEGNYNTAT